MPLEEERSGPWQNRSDTNSTSTSVTDNIAQERARRRWRLRQVGYRRKASVALDQRYGVEIPEPGVVQIDYAATGLALGWPERRAAGLALLELERAV